MSHIQLNILIARLLSMVVLAFAALAAGHARAAAPGITGPTFNLDAAPAYISEPDGSSIYSWGYGCSGAPAGFAPAAIGTAQGANCPDMQIPGPTLIVHEGELVTVTLTNNLPAAAGNTSILFPGFNVSTSGGVAGLLTQEAAPGGKVTYTFTATTPGTRTYYSGTQGDLQIEMGLYGVIIVLPNAVPAEPTVQGVPATCHGLAATLPDGQTDFRLAASAYDIPQSCYDREYLFQFSEIDPVIHSQAEAQAALPCTQPTGCMTVATEPYHPAYFMINGRSMPDDMDPNYAPQYPHQPYNGNPHVHPGERALIRETGTGRWQHPFHEHANHLHVLAWDANLLLAKTDPTKLAGPLLFTTTSTPGQAMDAIFYWTGKGLNWDVYANTLFDANGNIVPIGSKPSATSGPTPSNAVSMAAPWNNALTVWRRGAGTASDPFLYESEPCFPDANGYYTTASGAPATAPNYYEWCQDHMKPLEKHPFGQVGSGGPVTLPDPNILTNGLWYGGSPYLGPDATGRAIGTTSTTPPAGTIGNPREESGFGFMWHSHNEREITTNNIFPGGMMMMLLVDPQVFAINEAN
jgi:FtsP/CotA-like multicopper oxidase with cupredoxin domain